MRTLLLVVFLAGCTNTTDPILVQTVCTESHTESYVQMVYISNGRGGGQMMPQIHVRTVCDKSFDVEYPNPDYRGPDA